MTKRTKANKSDKYIKNQHCDECGSSDGSAVYEAVDGTRYTYCFKCEKRGRMDDDESEFEVEVVEKADPTRLNRIFTDLKSRGIDEEICKIYGVKAVVDEKGSDLFHFYPNTRNGQFLGSYCIRDVVSKKFTWWKAKEGGDFFGQSECGTGGKLLIVTEGACLPPETEVLTKQGWVTLSDYESQEVMQVEQLETGELSGSFIKPLTIVDKLFTGNMIDRSNKYGLSELVTDDHNVARLNMDGRLVKQRAKSLKNEHYLVPRVLDTISNNQSQDDDLVRLMVAFQSDGCFRVSNCVDFDFLKDYKINRLEVLLKRLGLHYVKYQPNSRGHTTFRIYGDSTTQLPEWVLVKSIKMSVILPIFSRSNYDAMVKEAKWWDGNVVKNRNQDEFNNTDKDTVESFQLAAHLSGYCSTIRSRQPEVSYDKSEVVDHYKRCYQVSILYGKSTSSVQLRPKVIPVVNQRVMCLTVPSGYLMIRQNGHISITGNCDMLAAKQMLLNQGKNYRICSIINGAQSAAKQFRQNYEWINSFESIILAFDMDQPGQEAAKAVAEMFTPSKVKILEMSEKDPNDMLRAGKSTEFLRSVYNAKAEKVAEVLSVDDLYDEALKEVDYGIPWCWDGLTKLTYGIRRGEIIGVGAGSGAGKSTFIREVMYDLSINKGIIVGGIFLEENPTTTLKSLAGLAMNKRFTIPKEEGHWTIEELRKGLSLFKDKVYLYDSLGSKNFDHIESKIRYMVVALGASVIMLDNLTVLLSAEASDFEGLGKIMPAIMSLAIELNITIFFVSHLRKKQGVGHSEGGSITLDEFRGNAAAVQYANVIIGLRRDTTHDNRDDRDLTKVVLLKERSQGTGVGDSILLKYSHETGRMLEVIEGDGDFDD